MYCRKLEIIILLFVQLKKPTKDKIYMLQNRVVLGRDNIYALNLALKDLSSKFDPKKGHQLQFHNYNIYIVKISFYILLNLYCTKLCKSYI